ncbi:MAG TPA: peptidylprolyl isomerase [Flavobacteriales bacterium]|nr:peptidylprolyl isomerase [Flavobacteriales bacterium]
MNKLSVLTVATIALLCHNSYAQPARSAADPQKDEVIMTVKGKPVYKSEFENIYKKNNKEVNVSKEALDEYMVLFTNFKLKVTEAEEMGMDTVRKFRDELDGYRKQLAKPYLVDQNMNDNMIMEAYDRLKTEVRASHILIKCEMDAAPEDTLKAYKKAMSIREKVLKSNDFGAIAAIPGNSDDPSATKNKGDLGYFTSLQMVYPFENACYKLKVGEISMPVRTRFGYHIIKVVDKRPSRGQIRVAHIMIIAKPEDPAEKQENARKKAEEILAKVKAGEDFAALASQYSEDQSSSRKGGELPAFGSGRMVPEFEDAAFALKTDGEISSIVKTNYGYHIIKRLELKMLEPFDEKKAELKQKIQRDTRSFLPKKSFIAKLKTKYNYADLNKKKDLYAFYAVVDTSIFDNEWKMEKAKGMEKPLAKFADKTYTQKDFAMYLWKNQRKQKNQDIKSYINNQYETFMGDELINYEDSKLEEQHPEFRALMKEYRDGILLFDLTDKKVWSKAVKDTAGLREYYNKNKTNYMHPERYDVVIYTCKDADLAKKVRSEVKKGKLTDDKILELFNKESQLNLKIEKGIFNAEEKDIIVKSGALTQKLGPDKLTADYKDASNQTVFIKLKEVLKPSPKSLIEAKGPITSDYQTWLEKEWIDSLKAKYPVVVNKDVLYGIKKD